jgi:hypothetical protein
VGYESITKLWLCNKKYGNVNMVIAAVCWCVGHMGQHEGVLVESADNVAMLENLGAGTNPMDTKDRDWCLACWGAHHGVKSLCGSV